MTIIYKVEFSPRSKKAFDKLDRGLQRQLASKLQERCANPRVQPDKLRGMPDCYRIKFRASGVRLIYQVCDSVLLLLVIGVGSREHEKAYRLAMAELSQVGD